MASLCSIDPGIRKCGWAYWADGVLTACGLSKSSHTQSLARIAHEHSHHIPKAHAVAIEIMQYRQGAAKGDAQDLLDIMFVAGTLAQVLNYSAVAREVRVLDWKGSRPRAVEQNRTRKALTPEELKLLPVLKTPNSVGHDTWSAVGIGLYVLGRYE